jgi:flagellar biosynthetic protein FliO
MLLAKSKESKNSSKNNNFRFGSNLLPTLFPIGKSVRGAVIFLTSIILSSLLLVVAPYSYAQTEPSSGSAPSLSSWVTVALSLFVIIGFILFLGYLMRRFSFNQSGGGQMKTIASMMVGTRERIAVIQVGDEQHLIGVTSQNINHLAKLEKPLPEEQNSVALKSTFANFLQQQKHIQGKKHD